WPGLLLVRIADRKRRRRRPPRNDRRQRRGPGRSQARPPTPTPAVERSSRMATETEYVDAGAAVDFRILSPGLAGKAPPVTKGVNYDRILKARDAEPHN